MLAWGESQLGPLAALFLLSTSISRCSELFFVILILPPPPPLLGSSQKGILGCREGVFSFPFCVHVIYLTIVPPPHWPFLIPPFYMVQAIKTLISRKEKKKGREAI